MVARTVKNYKEFNRDSGYDYKKQEAQAVADCIRIYV